MFERRSKKAPVKNRIAINKGKSAPTDNQSILKLSKSDPPSPVFFRLQFLLVYGEESIPLSDDENYNEGNRNETSEPPFLPPHHFFYATQNALPYGAKQDIGRLSKHPCFSIHQPSVMLSKQPLLQCFLVLKQPPSPHQEFGDFLEGLQLLVCFQFSHGSSLLSLEGGWFMSDCPC
mmetsp:Transcript_12537/g.26354  ORF Transcript_12537/g.26354 Transcript_12537/m.26354 type:complete len:176 (+) Transcript_12537:971-1498(+)